MRHVIKTYRYSKAPFVAVDTMWITLAMMGRDRAADHFARWAKDVGLADPELIGPEQDWEEAFGSAAGWDSFYNAIAAPGYRPPGGVESYLPERHEYDFMIPWIARELGRIAKEMRKGRATTEDYNLAVNTVFSKAPAIAMWAIQERVDIGRTSLVEALKAIEHFDAFAGEMPQGKVLHEWDDGFTVQSLETEEQLEAEGEAMQHCVGDYCLDDMPHAEIFSLRDDRGMPHVTMEWDNLRNRFVQIYGKQNEPPVEKYVPYLKEFIDRRFAGDPLGLLMAGVDPSGVDFSGRDFEDINFRDYINPRDQDMAGADFRGSTLQDCYFHGLDLSGANFREAELHNVLLVRCQLSETSFEDAELQMVNMREANLVNARFDYASLELVNFSGATLTGASFANAEFGDPLSPKRHPYGHRGVMEHEPESLFSKVSVKFPFKQLSMIDFHGSEIGIEYIAPAVVEDPHMIPGAAKVIALMYKPQYLRDTPAWEWFEEHGHRADELPDPVGLEDAL